MLVLCIVHNDFRCIINCVRRSVQPRVYMHIYSQPITLCVANAIHRYRVEWISVGCLLSTYVAHITDSTVNESVFKPYVHYYVMKFHLCTTIAIKSQFVSCLNLSHDFRFFSSYEERNGLYLLTVPLPRSAATSQTLSICFSTFLIINLSTSTFILQGIR